MKKMDDRGQASQLIMLIFVFLIMIFVFGDPGIRAWIAVSLHSVLFPTIGFEGHYPILTLLIAGLLVVTLSSLLTNFFTDWKKMGEAQERQRAFQKEMSKARREGNQNRVQKLMKMQPQIMKQQTEASSGMMKPMFFLIIFIAPIFIWLTYFFGQLQYYYLTVPWATGVSLFSRPFPGGILMQAWLWVYLIISMVFGQLMRQGFKWVSWSDWWQQTRKRLRPSARLGK